MIMWKTIRLILTLSIIIGRHKWLLDFVLAYPHTKVDGDRYMILPKRFELPCCNEKGAHVPNLIRSIHGPNQAGNVWNIHLHNSLLNFEIYLFKNGSI